MLNSPSSSGPLVCHGVEGVDAYQGFGRITLWFKASRTLMLWPELANELVNAGVAFSRTS